MPAKTYHRKLYQYVVEEIGQQIIRGAYGIGDILPTEDRLSEEMQVSRGVLREAIQVLAQKGLIQTRPRIGSQILPRKKWNLFDPDVLVWRLQIEDKTTFLKDVTEVRRLIESEAAKQAARRATEVEIDDIKTLLDRLKEKLDDPDSYNYDAYLSLDIRFHTMILEASHNDLLAQIGRTIRDAVHQARQIDTSDVGIQKESWPYHAALAESIEKKDPQAAYEASQAMFANIWQHIVKA